MESSEAPNNPSNKPSGWHRIVLAWGYSKEGMRAAWRTQQAFRVDCAVGVVGVVVAFMLPVGITLRLLLIMTLAGVLIAELLNSAIEVTIDRISLELHPLSKLAKDYGSAAVAIAWLLSAFCWVMVLMSLVFR
jgi:diacylglycerol kinase (ATP)